MNPDRRSASRNLLQENNTILSKETTEVKLAVRTFKKILGVFFVIGALGSISSNLFLATVFGLAAYAVFNSLRKSIPNTNKDNVVDLPKQQHAFNQNNGILNFIKLYNLDELPDQFAVLDIETTGLNHLFDKIIEIAIIHVKNGEIVDRFSQLIDPEKSIPKEVSRINGINDFMVKGQPKIDEVIHEIYSRISSEPLIVGYNIEFDLKFIHVSLAEAGLSIPSVSYLDVKNLVRQTLKTDLPNLKLETVKKHFGIEHVSHRAISDCDVTLEVLNRCLKIKEERRKQYRLKQIQLISQLNDNEKAFISTLQDKLRECGITGQLAYNVLSNKIINFTIDGIQIGRVKLSGKKYKMQILDGDNAVWLDIDDLSEAIGNIKHWIKYATKLSS